MSLAHAAANTANRQKRRVKRIERICLFLIWGQPWRQASSVIGYMSMVAMHNGAASSGSHGDPDRKRAPFD